jgi:hypothetical protein
MLFGFLAAVNALSSSGNRLLVVLEDSAEKGLYSTLWGDLEGMAMSNSCGIGKLNANCPA